MNLVLGLLVQCSSYSATLFLRSVHREPRGEAGAGQCCGASDPACRGGGEAPPAGGRQKVPQSCVCVGGGVSHRLGSHQQGWDREVVLSGHLFRKFEDSPLEELEGLRKTSDEVHGVEEGALQHCQIEAHDWKRILRDSGEPLTDTEQGVDPVPGTT